MKLNTPEAAANQLRHSATDQMAVAILDDQLQVLQTVQVSPKLLYLASVTALQERKARYAMAFIKRDDLAFNESDFKTTEDLRRNLGVFDGFLVDTLLISDEGVVSMMRDGP